MKKHERLWKRIKDHLSDIIVSSPDPDEARTAQAIYSKMDELEAEEKVIEAASAAVLASAERMIAQAVMEHIPTKSIRPLLKSVLGEDFRHLRENFPAAYWS